LRRIAVSLPTALARVANSRRQLGKERQINLPPFAATIRTMRLGAWWTPVTSEVSGNRSAAAIDVRGLSRQALLMGNGLLPFQLIHVISWKFLISSSNTYPIFEDAQSLSPLSPWLR
jgi:hypothetical protein